MSTPLIEGVRGARAGYVLAHGAGAGMTHPFMAAAAKGLAERSIQRPDSVRMEISPFV